MSRSERIKIYVGIFLWGVTAGTYVARWVDNLSQESVLNLTWAMIAAFALWWVGHLWCLWRSGR
jgi:hypothetical protein